MSSKREWECRFCGTEYEYWTDGLLTCCQRGMDAPTQTALIPVFNRVDALNFVRRLIKKGTILKEEL